MSDVTQTIPTMINGKVYGAVTGIELPTWVRTALATVPHGFTGRIELNCAHGGVANMNLLWSVKPS